MTTYARIENGVAVEFPLYEGDLANRFPDLLFPMDTHGTPIPDGYVVVKGTNPPHNLAYTYALGVPTIQDGVWATNWIETPRSDEEKARIQGAVEDRVRSERNAKLLASDWVVTKAVEQNAQNSFGVQIPVVWLTYRQALRDITTQSGFPWTVTWPESP
jgi:hypothetical protein